MNEATNIIPAMSTNIETAMPTSVKRSNVLSKLQVLSHIKTLSFSRFRQKCQFILLHIQGYLKIFFQTNGHRKHCITNNLFPKDFIQLV